MIDTPTAAETAVLYNGRAAEMLIGYVDPATGKLHTIQLEETWVDRGEVSRLLDFDWERRVPPGTSIVLPAAGHPLVKLDKYWSLWRAEDRLFAQSTHREAVLSAVMEPEDWIIDRPVVTGNRELHVYGWRGGLLIRYRFTTEAILEAALKLDARPTRSICAPVPGDDGATTFIGYVNEVDGAIVANALYIRGKKVMPVEARADGRYRLMPRHRIGVHVGTKVRPALAIMTESLDDGTYVLLEARFDFAKSECVWKRTKLENVPAGDLQSATIYYYKTQDASEPFILALNQAGHLVLPRRRTVTVIREDAGPNYGYPILTTLTNRYEAIGSGSDISLRRF